MELPVEQFISSAPTLKRLLIVGNSGSGKSWLGNQLALRLQLPHTDLDTIFWQDHNYRSKRTEQQVRAHISALQQQPNWLVEGVFGKLVGPLSNRADCLIFLDMPWPLCRHRLLNREPQGPRLPEGITAFSDLLSWAEEYDRRQSPSSHHGHQQLFEHFQGLRLCLQSQEQVTALLEDLRVRV